MFSSSDSRRSSILSKVTDLPLRNKKWKKFSRMLSNKNLMLNDPYQHKLSYKLTFNEVIFLLKKPFNNRKDIEKNMESLVNFFTEGHNKNKFFCDMIEKYKVEAVENWFRVLQYQSFNKGDYVVKQGEDGDTFFIILDGKIQILINTDVTGEFSCIEIFKIIVEEYESIIDNEQKQHILKELKYYFKRFINSEERNGKEYYFISDFAEAKLALENEKNIKNFYRTNNYGIKEIVNLPFSYTIMKEVGIIETGGSVGEYALMHKKKRSATVRCLTDCHFATMNREGFEKVMLEIKLKESKVVVDFLDQYPFFKSLTFNTKAKLAYRLKTKK